MQDVLPPQEHHVLKAYIRAIAYQKTLGRAEKKHSLNTYEAIDSELNKLMQFHDFREEDLKVKKSSDNDKDLDKAQSLYKIKKVLGVLSNKYKKSLDKIEAAKRHHNRKPLDMLTLIPGEPEATGAYLYYSTHKQSSIKKASVLVARKFSSLMAAQYSMLSQAEGSRTQKKTPFFQALVNGQVLMQQCGLESCSDDNNRRGVIHTLNRQLRSNEAVALPIIISANTGTTDSLTLNEALLEIQRKGKAQYRIHCYRLLETNSDQNEKIFSVTTHDNVPLTQSQIYTLLMSTRDDTSCSMVKDLLDEIGVGFGTVTSIPTTKDGDVINAYVMHRGGYNSQQLIKFEQAYLEKHLDIVKAELSAYREESVEADKQIYIRHGKQEVIKAIDKYHALSQYLQLTDGSEFSPSVNLSR